MSAPQRSQMVLTAKCCDKEASGLLLGSVAFSNSIIHRGISQKVQINEEVDGGVVPLGGVDDVKK